MTTEDKVMRLKSDPRFVRPKKKQTKLTVDSRFKGMFESEEFQAPVKVDKYGRKIIDKTAGQDLKRFYQLEEEEELEEASKSEKLDSENSDTQSECSGTEDSSESDEEDYTDEEEPQMMVFEETLEHHPLVNQNVEIGEATRRFALVNLDWDQIKAIDILHMVQGFKPVTGVIESVKIYPSEFGKERMALEAVQGPPKDIFTPKDDEEEEPKAQKQIVTDDCEDFNSAQLRKYQLERLRYFYAVITCDSVETSAAIYKHCDGAEFEMSANFLDLRYIPDEVSFDGDEPTDIADRTTKKYTPKTDVITPALQHSKVKLTWDMDDPDRARLTKVDFAKFDYNENDLRAYLASSSEDDDEEEDKIDPAKYRELLLSGNNGNVFGRKSHEDNDELQVTFTTGFGDVRPSSDDEDDDIHMEATFDAEENSADEDSAKKDETVFESQLRKMREKKKAKKEARLAKIAEIKAAEKAEKLAARKKKRHHDDQDGGEKAGKAAELDLLMLDDTPDAMSGRHFDMSDIIKSEKRKGKKSKKSATTNAPSSTVDEFKLDVKDDRFKAIYDEPAYSIDPTHSSFKKTSAMRSLIDERQRRVKSRGM